MKKTMKIRNAGYCLLVLIFSFTFSACSSEDDVMEIFNGKTWKLSRLTTEDSKAQFYPGLWSNETEEKNSRAALKENGNFTVNFNCAEVNGEVTGTVNAHGIKASINDATLNIDGKKRSLTIGGKINGSETDKLAKEFLKGMLGVFKYEGDARSLTLYFKDGKTTKVMGFTAQQ